MTALAASEAVGVVDDDDRHAVGGGDRFERAVDVLQHFAGGEFGEIRPTLADAPLENHVLDLMASGLASSRAELEEMLLSSFTGWAHWAQKISRAEFSEALSKAVACGIGGGLLRALEGDQLEVTAVGRVEIADIRIRQRCQEDPLCYPRIQRGPNPFRP